MNKLSFLLLTLLIAVVASTAWVQQDQTRIAFVDAQAAIRAHPAGAQAKLLEDQAKAEVDALQTDLQAIVTKANSGQQLTADEQSRFQTLRSTIVSVQQRYADEIATAVNPALQAVDQVITELATANDYSVVLDSRIAGQGGINLVVYAKPDLNITQEVIDRVSTMQ
jgi:outer membrane protein